MTVRTQSIASSSTIAVFDFDGTLTYRDSLFPFIYMAVGFPRFLWGLLLLSPVLFGYAIRLVKNSDAKQAVLRHFFAGIDIEAFQELGNTFAIESLPSMLRPEAVQRLRWHQQHGHRIIVVSASLETYLQPWAKTMQCDQVIGSRIEVVDGQITGRLSGKNCYGPEKVERLEGLLGKLDTYFVYAYGDSKGDRELLAAADQGFFRHFPDAGQV